MKTYKKDYFIPYPIETVREVLHTPVKIPFVPLTDQSELAVKNANDWFIKRENGPGRPDTMIHVECAYDEEKDLLTVNMHSKRKQLTDVATAELHYVGDFRTRLSLRYDIAYCWYKLSHIRQRIAVAYNSHKIYIDTFQNVIDAINREAEHLLTEE
ncbi:MAG: hypothetical protein IJL78_08125 [Lachnospiraceae bacterium]|nr:hypothetical protein [Lachnospiraceae bacterium]